MYRAVRRADALPAPRAMRAPVGCLSLTERREREPTLPPIGGKVHLRAEPRSHTLKSCGLAGESRLFWQAMLVVTR
jgi:hypothetical protein